MFGRKRRGPSKRFVTYEDDANVGAADETYGLLKPWTGDAQGNNPAGQAAGMHATYQGLYLGR